MMATMRSVRHHILAAFSVALAALPLAAQEPCLSTPAWERLKAVYPEGVPGRQMAMDKASAEPTHTYIIPVVVHVMHYYDLELAVNKDWCLAQMDAMNQAFGRYGSGYNEHPEGATAGIRFALATIDPNGNPTDGWEQVEFSETFNFDIEDEEVMKKSALWDPCRYLNIWVVNNLDGFGIAYAYFPDQVACTWYDGIVVEYDNFGTHDVSTIVTGEGDVVSHEAGHYLGLDHTWGRDNTTICDKEDGCDDTPLCAGTYFTTEDSCDLPLQCDQYRQIENYMDYSSDGCRNMFTNCQVAKMRNSIIQYRSTLVSTSNLIATGVASELDSIAYSGSLIMYPNPTSNTVFVYDGTADSLGVTVEVYDFAGNLVLMRQNVDARAGEAIDVRSLEAGWYHFVLKSHSQYQRRTMLVAR